MSVFKLGYNKVDRRVVLPGVKAAMVFDIPAGAVVKRVYAQNRSTTAANLSLGTAAGGAEYLAAVAVPVANAQGAGILSPKNALQPAVPRVAANVHVTLSAYPVSNPTAPAAQQKGAIDVVIEYEEMWDSLPLPTQHFPRAY